MIPIQTTTLITLLIFLSFSLFSPLTLWAAFHAPKGVKASDGTYEKYVLIRWIAPKNATAFKVFRSTGSRSARAIEISNQWQKSAVIYDYGARPGVDYYYSVIATYDGKESPQSNADVGFVKNNGASAETPFMPNDYLESMVANVQESQFDFKFPSTFADTVFFAEIDTKIFFSGTLTTTQRLSNRAFELYVYSNQKEAYINDIPISVHSLEMVKQITGYDVSTSILLPKNRGLYYCVITSSEDNQPIWVGRFRME